MAERKTVITVREDGGLDVEAKGGVKILKKPSGEVLHIGPVTHLVRPPGEKMVVRKKAEILLKVKEEEREDVILEMEVPKGIETIVKGIDDGKKAIMTIKVDDLTSGNLKKQEYECRWHEPTKGTREPNEPISSLEAVLAIRAEGGTPERKTSILGEVLREFLGHELEGKFLRNDPQFAVITHDSRYYCPPLEDAAKIIATSGLDCKKWVRDAFDCDDFAYVLKAHFAEAAYIHGTRRKDERPAHALGIIIARVTVQMPGEEPEEPYGHAFNWMVNDDLKLRFIEPQTGYLIDPRAGVVSRFDPDTGGFFRLEPQPDRILCPEGDPERVEVEDIDFMVG